MACMDKEQERLLIEASTRAACLLVLSGPDRLTGTALLEIFAAVGLGPHIEDIPLVGGFLVRFCPYVEGQLREAYGTLDSAARKK